MCISVVIPCYNSERYLSAAVWSVLSQTLSDWELLIVDDGSQDSTPQIAAAYAAKDKRIKLIEMPNSGVAEARNTGFCHLSRDKEYVCFLDSDDEFAPDTLQVLKKSIESHPNTVAAHGAVRFIDENGEPTTDPHLKAQVAERKAFVGNRIVPSPSSRFTTFEMLIVANCITTPGACLIRRSALEAVGLFDREMSTCEDWDLWIRLARREAIAYTDHVVVAYRRHSENATNHVERHRLASDRVRNKATFSPENNAHQAKIARSVYSLFAAEERRDRLQWAREELLHGNVLSAAKQFRHATLAKAKSLRAEL